MKCQKCGKKFEPQDVRLEEAYKETVLELRVACDHCHAVHYRFLQTGGFDVDAEADDE